LQLIFAGKDYPGGLEYIRNKAKPQFFALKNEQDAKVIKAALEKGEYILTEIQGLTRLHKYRTLKKKYYSDHQVPPD
jgi:hypothetical protein